MIPVAPLFPVFTTPPGWKKEPSGPKLFVTPPEPGARIVVPPILPHKSWLDAKELLERTLLEELKNFKKVKRTEMVDLTSAGGLKGSFIEIAGLNEDGTVKEWRSYAAYQDEQRLLLFILQAHPSRFEKVRQQFLALVHSVMPGAAYFDGSGPA